MLLLAAAAARAAHARTPYSEPEIRSVETPDEAKVRELSDQEVTQLRIALGRRLPVNRMADLYFRLAEIQLEAYRRTFLLEGRVHEKRLGAGREDATIDRSRSAPYLRSGLKACEEILKYKIPYARMDQVYYFLGFYHGELGNRDQSEKFFAELVRRYPRSEFLGEAQRELGDLAFEAGEFRKAMAAYEGALATGAHGAGASVRPRLLHKLAWAFYRTKQFDRAVATMKEAVAGASASGEKFLSLKEEALKDMAMFMTETGRAEEAIRYFREVADEEFYPRVLEKLGRQYERNVESAKAVQVYESLLKTNPRSQEGFRVLVKLVELDLRRGKAREAIERVRRYGSMPRASRSGDEETAGAAANLKAMIRRTGTENHDLYRNKRDPKALAVAELAYSTYLEKFLAEDDPRKETPEIRMYLAEVKRELGQAKEASQLYRQVIESKDPRYAKEAGALWTASLADAIRKGGSSSGAKEPTALEREFVDAADHLAENLAETTEGREAALKAAQLLAGYASARKDALRRASKIVASWPRSQQAILAARLQVQLTSENLDPESIGDTQGLIQELRKNPALMATDQESGGKLKALLAELESRIQVAAIAQEESDKDYKSAAKGYEAFAQGASSRDVAEKALASAVASYLKAEEAEDVERVASSWFKRYPGSRRAVESLRAVATQSLIQGEYASSARMFDRIAREGADPESVDAAARIWEGLGERNKAQRAWVDAMTRFPGYSGRFAWGLSLGLAQERERLESEAAKAYQYCQQAGGELEAECGARLGDLHLRALDSDGARLAYERAAAQGGRGKKGGSSAAGPYVGYARYQLAELLQRGARFDKIALPEAALRKSIQQRLSFLEPLARAYQSAVDAGGPWAVAALGRLADWATQFADELDSLPGTPEFRSSLRSVSGPLRKKALDAWRDAHRKAQQASLLSPALPGISDRLSDQRLAEPARAQGARGGFRLSGTPPNGGDEGLGKAFSRVRGRLLRNPKDAVAWADYGNLLWGDNKPGLSRLAYERSLALDPKLAASWSNQGAVTLMTDGEEDWAAALRAHQSFQRALEIDPFFLAAKANRAQLLNYYRVFVPALPLWQQAVAKSGEAPLLEGLAVALQGTGGSEAAAQAAARARGADGAHSEFALRFNEAARAGLEPGEGPRKCLRGLESLDEGALQGFEKQAYNQLKEACERWNRGKTQ